MCSEPCGAVGEPNGICPDCGEETIDEVSTDICEYSPIMCFVCGRAPCDLSC